MCNLQYFSITLLTLKYCVQAQTTMKFEAKHLQDIHGVVCECDTSLHWLKPELFKYLVGGKMWLQFTGTSIALWEFYFPIAPAVFPGCCALLLSLLVRGTTGWSLSIPGGGLFDEVVHNGTWKPFAKERSLRQQCFSNSCNATLSVIPMLGSMCSILFSDVML